MAKREKCEHGNAVVKFDGCYECVMLAMHGLKILRDNKIDGPVLYCLLRNAYPDRDAWQAGLSKARAQVEEANKKPVEEVGNGGRA